MLLVVEVGVLMVIVAVAELVEVVEDVVEVLPIHLWSIVSLPLVHVEVREGPVEAREQEGPSSQPALTGNPMPYSL